MSVKLKDSSMVQNIEPMELPAEVGNSDSGEMMFEDETGGFISPSAPQGAQQLVIDAQLVADHCLFKV